MTDITSTPVEATASTEGGEAASTVPTPQKPVNPYAGTKHRVKYGGADEREISYEELVSDHQQKVVSQRNFNKAAQMRREMEELVNGLRQGDADAIRAVKQLVPKDLWLKSAEGDLSEYIEYEKLSPDAKRALAAEQRAQQLEQEIEVRTKAEKDAAMTAINQQAMQEIDEGLTRAVKSFREMHGYDAKITPRFIQKAAEQMLAHLESSETASITPDKAVGQAWNGLLEDVKIAFDALSAKEIAALLPPSKRDALRQLEIEAATSQLHDRSRAQQPREQSVSKAKKQPLASTNDFFAARDKKYFSR